MTLRVFLPRPPGGEFLSDLGKGLQPGVALVDDAASAAVLVCGTPEREWLHAGVRAVVVPYAGVPHRTLALLRDFPAVALHNLHHNAAPTAELAVALLLAAAKSLVPLDRALRAGDWRPRYAERDDLLLAGRTALVLGYGAVGRRVAAACRGLGLHVVATRRGGPCAGPDEVHGPEALADLLPRAHAAVVCLPWTPETDGLLGRAELALLPRGAVLVNVGRGPIVAEEALFEALREGRLRAGLDVWYRYPEDEAARVSTPPSAYPFHELPNAVLSPHRAGSSEGIERLRAEALAALLNAAARGAPMPNRVDPERGY